jgi:hypothetical protein
MLLFSVKAAYGQTTMPTASDMESLLDTEEVSCSQAAYFVLAAAMENPPPNPGAAFAEALERGWLPAKAESGSGVTLGGLSLLVMKAFGRRVPNAGLLYRLFPGSRYAYRALASQGFIEGRAYPSLKVSGEQFLRILEKILAEGETE